MENVIDVGEKIAIDSTPIVSVADYIAIKAESSKGFKKNMKKKAINSSTMLLQAKRKQQAAEEFLRKKREEVKISEEQFRIRWSNLKDREQDLRKLFLKYDRLICENIQKRERSKAKMEKELERQNLLEKRTDELSSKISLLEIEKDRLLEQLQGYDTTASLLKRIVDKSEDIANVEELVNRYELLLKTSLSSSKKHFDTLHRAVTIKSQIQFNSENEKLLTMELNAKLEKLRVRYEEAKKNHRQWEAVLTKAYAFAEEKSLEIEQVKSAAWNLYKRMQRQLKQRLYINQLNTEAQLTYITNRIIELKEITFLVEEQEMKEIESISHLF